MAMFEFMINMSRKNKELCYRLNLEILVWYGDFKPGRQIK